MGWPDETPYLIFCQHVARHQELDQENSICHGDTWRNCRLQPPNPLNTRARLLILCFSSVTSVTSCSKRILNRRSRRSQRTRVLILFKSSVDSDESDLRNASHTLMKCATKTAEPSHSKSPKFRPFHQSRVRVRGFSSVFNTRPQNSQFTNSRIGINKSE